MTTRSGPRQPPSAPSPADGHSSQPREAWEQNTVLIITLLFVWLGAILIIFFHNCLGATCAALQTRRASRPSSTSLFSFHSPQGVQVRIIGGRFSMKTSRGNEPASRSDRSFWHRSGDRKPRLDNSLSSTT